MRFLLFVTCLVMLLSGCETCKKPCVKPTEGAIVRQAKSLVSNTASIVSAVTLAPAACGEKLINPENASLVSIKETPKTFKESSIFRKEGAK